MPGKISSREVKKIRKTLLINLVFADLVLLSGLLMNWQGGEQWQISSIALITLGAAWVIMSVNRMMRFRRFLASNKEQ